MIRPAAIARYEKLYVASFVLGLIAAATTWSDRTAIIAANPTLASATWILPTMQAFGIAVTLLLWYFTARAPSIVAKWVVVVLAAIGILGMVLSLGAVLLGRSSIGTAVVLSLIVNAVYAAAAVQLFDQDAKLWFGEFPDDDDYQDGEWPHDR